MKRWKEKTWQHEIIGVDGNTILFGVNIFDHKWKSTNQSVMIRDPLYGQEYKFSVYKAIINGQEYKFSVYKVIINGQEYEFAAGEFSNCVWGFYILKF